MLASLTFLTPFGALVALAVAVPLAAAAASVSRSNRAAQALGLEPAPRSRIAAPAALAAVACVCAGLAAAQPVLREPRHQRIRTRSEILYIVDVSRSMAASHGPTAPTRLAEARLAVERMRDATPDVPSGLAGLTDRVLPYLFPTPDRSVFAATLAQSVLVEAPPPQEVSINATSFGSLTALVGAGYFDRSAQYRTCVLVTDGESRSYDVQAVASALSTERCRLVVLRVGSAADRVYDADGVPEAGYVPLAAAAQEVEQLGQAAGGKAFSTGDLGGAVDAVRADAESGPTGSTTARTTDHALARWFALAALAAAVLLVAARLGLLRDATSAAYNRGMTSSEPTA